ASCFVMFDPYLDESSWFFPSEGLELRVILLLLPVLSAIPMLLRLRRSEHPAGRLLAAMLGGLSLLLVLACAYQPGHNPGYALGNLPPILLGLLMPALYLATLWLTHARQFSRLLLLGLPALAGAFSLVLLIVTMFSGSYSDYAQLMHELIRSAAAFSIGSVLAVQSSVFWCDLQSIDVPAIAWWRWPLYGLLQFMGLLVLHRLALQQIGAWRRLEE